MATKEKDFILLKHLLLDIYIKFERIIKTHGYIIELIHHISIKRNKKEEFSDLGNFKSINHSNQLEYSLTEVFTAVQNEIKSLLNEYLNANAEVNDSSIPFLTVQPRVKRKETAIKVYIIFL